MPLAFTAEAIALYLTVALLACLGLGYYVALARGLPPGPRPSGFGWPDALAAAFLAGWFVLVIASSRGDAQLVSTETILGSAVVYGGLVAILLGFLAVRGIAPVGALGLAWPGWRREMPTVALGLLCILPVIAAAQWAGSRLGAAGEENQPLLDFWLANTGLGDRFLVVAMAVVVAPLAEEAIFRGYLYNAAARYAGRWWGMLATSLLFAAVHIHLPAFLGLFVLALALNLLYERFGTLWAPISAHAGFNALSLLAAALWPEML